MSPNSRKDIASLLDLGCKKKLLVEKLWKEKGKKPTNKDLIIFLRN